jgi:hypothetical protein
MTESSEKLYFLNQLYRDFILPDILGSDTSEILYWSGKHVSRKYDLASEDDLEEFFDMAGFGELVLTKENRREMIWTLSGQNIQDRIASGAKEFSLESGIIAQAAQNQQERDTEAAAVISKKGDSVQFTARFD